MRIAAGAHRVTATDGTILHLDQPANRETVDLLTQTIRQAGLTPSDVLSITLHRDGPATIEQARDRLTIGTTEFAIGETMEPQVLTVHISDGAQQWATATPPPRTDATAEPTNTNDSPGHPS